jgi:dephospho-CoA kinase
MLLVGITGSIGCGKTTLAKIVKKLGYAVLDIDGWVRKIYYNKDFLKVLGQAFPGAVQNGVADKRYLRKLVFNDKTQLERLESLIYPFLNAQIRRLIQKHAQKNTIFFLDAALLFEKKWDKYCDFIILADVEYEIQKQRVMKRDNVSAEDFDSINDIQIKNEDKKHKVNKVIDTNNSLNLLKVELIDVLNSLELAK